jgi:hypothetical protein
MASDPLIHLLLWQLERNDVEMAQQRRRTVKHARRVNAAASQVAPRPASAWGRARKHTGGRP